MSTHRDQWTIGIMILVGGAAVLGSYAHGLLLHAPVAGALWGNVPDALIPYYTASMLPATLGFLLFSYYILFGLDAGSVRIAGRFSYRIFYLLYLLILVPSALWMPLTIQMILAPGPWLWVLIRLVLALVALGALGMLAALFTAGPAARPVSRRLAIIGALAFCNQTVILDALIWPSYFPFTW